jgi:hypothetical protein
MKAAYLFGNETCCSTSRILPEQAAPGADDRHWVALAQRSAVRAARNQPPKLQEGDDLRLVARRRDAR